MTRKQSRTVAHHRNGVSGEGFHVVLFKQRAGRRSRQMVGIVFRKKKHVAVFDVAELAKGNIEFGSNSWRGDDFEKMLRDRVKAYEKSRKDGAA